MSVKLVFRVLQRAARLRWRSDAEGRYWVARADVDADAQPVAEDVDAEDADAEDPSVLWEEVALVSWCNTEVRRGSFRDSSTGRRVGLVHFEQTNTNPVSMPFCGAVSLLANQKFGDGVKRSIMMRYDAYPRDGMNRHQD